MTILEQYNPRSFRRAMQACNEANAKRYKKKAIDKLHKLLKGGKG